MLYIGLCSLKYCVIFYLVYDFRLISLTKSFSEMANRCWDYPWYDNWTRILDRTSEFFSRQLTLINRDGLQSVINELTRLVLDKYLKVQGQSNTLRYSSHAPGRPQISTGIRRAVKYKKGGGWTIYRSICDPIFSGILNFSDCQLVDINSKQSMTSLYDHIPRQGEPLPRDAVLYRQ